MSHVWQIGGAFGIKICQKYVNVLEITSKYNKNIELEWYVFILTEKKARPENKKGK